MRSPLDGDVECLNLYLASPSIVNKVLGSNFIIYFSYSLLRQKSHSVPKDKITTLLSKTAVLSIWGPIYCPTE